MSTPHEVTKNDEMVAVVDRVECLPEVMQTIKQKQKREVMRIHSFGQNCINTTRKDGATSTNKTMNQLYADGTVFPWFDVRMSRRAQLDNHYKTVMIKLWGEVQPKESMTFTSREMCRRITPISRAERHSLVKLH